MNLVDFVIMSLLVLLVGLLIYCSFVKNRGNPCHNCPYYKRCDMKKCKEKKTGKGEM